MSQEATMSKEDALHLRDTLQFIKNCIYTDDEEDGQLTIFPGRDEHGNPINVLASFVINHTVKELMVKPICEIALHSEIQIPEEVLDRRDMYKRFVTQKIDTNGYQEDFGGE